MIVGTPAVLAVAFGQQRPAARGGGAAADAAGELEVAFGYGECGAAVTYCCTPLPGVVAAVGGEGGGADEGWACAAEAGDAEVAAAGAAVLAVVETETERCDKSATQAADVDPTCQERSVCEGQRVHVGRRR